MLSARSVCTEGVHRNKLLHLNHITAKTKEDFVSPSQIKGLHQDNHNVCRKGRDYNCSFSGNLEVSVCLVWGGQQGQKKCMVK